MTRILQENLARIVRQNNLGAEEVTVRAFPLSPEEAIGTPAEKDYPLLQGRERLMQAEFQGAKGQAFTDLYGNFDGTLAEVLEMGLEDNFRRAVLVSSLNAVMRHLGLVSNTIHCKDGEPRECAQELVQYLKEKHSGRKVALVGFQPRMAESLAQQFELRITDLDDANIGQKKYGVKICGPERTAEHLEWCDLALVTGTTVTNGTLAPFLATPNPVIFFGVTIAGAAELLQLEHFCPKSL